MRWLKCFSCLFPQKERKPTYRSVHPGSQNNSTYNSSLLLQNTSNHEVVTLMAQLHKSRRNSCISFRSTPNAESTRKRRYSESSEDHFLKIIAKRPKHAMISKASLKLYREIAGVLVLDHPLRKSQRRTPPVPIRSSPRKKTV